MKKPIWKKGIICLICLTLVVGLLGDCLLHYMKIKTEENNKIIEEQVQRLLIYRIVDLAYDFGMEGDRLEGRTGMYILDKTETYENVFLYAGKDLADAAIERGEIGERDLYAYATETTLKRLKLLNLFIEHHDLADKLDKYDLEYPITVDDLVNKTELFWQFVNDDTLISSWDYRVITKRTELFEEFL